MTPRKGNPDQYLQRVGNTYYARVKVPRTLQKYVKQSHLRRSLKTSSRAEANLKKHAVVAQLKAELDDLRKNPPRADGMGFTFADARAVREQLEQLRARGEYEDAATLESVMVEQAKKVEALYGYPRALKWFRAATGTEKTLKEHHEHWLSISDYRESTKAGHRKALQEVLDFVDNEDATPADVTLEVALSYIENDLVRRGLAYNTIRDRLVSLGGFWKWLASRGAVPRDHDPWANHKISRKQHTGTRPPKRAYTEDELLQLLRGNETVRRWPTYSYLPDLLVLGLFTGARIESLAVLRAENAERVKEGFILFVPDQKTKAGQRYVAVTHPAPIAVIEKRLHGRKRGEHLFSELSPGGLDNKMSSSAVKAYTRYRRTCGVPDGTDFHSFRRVVVTVLEHAGVPQVQIARFVGHKVGTLAADTYSAGGSQMMALEVSRRIRFAKAVEEAALAAAGADDRARRRRA